MQKLSRKHFCVEICWLGLPRKYITTKIYTHYANTLRKWQMTQEISVFVAFTCIASSGRRILGKCLTDTEPPDHPVSETGGSRYTYTYKNCSIQFRSSLRISEPLVSLIIKQSPHYSEHTIAVQKAAKATCELTIGLLHKKRLRPRGHNCPNHNNSEWTWWVRRELPAGWLLYLFRSSGSPSTSRPLEMHCVSGTDGSLRDFHHTVHVVRLKPQSYT